MTTRTEDLLNVLEEQMQRVDSLLMLLIRGDFADGCACSGRHEDGYHLCAWHAGIAEQVERARDQLLYAARAAQKRE